MPFITEEIYHLLKEQKVDLAVKQFEELRITELSEEEKRSIELTEISKQLIQKIRDFRNKRGIKKDKKIDVISEDSSFHEYRFDDRLKIVNAELDKKVKVIGELSDKGNSAGLELILIGTSKFYLDLQNIEIIFQNILKNSKQQELNHELEHLKGFLNSVDKKLNNEKFVQNAKAEVIELERKKKADAETKIKIIEESLTSLK
jgi:valyl-tRNA synthetase